MTAEHDLYYALLKGYLIESGGMIKLISPAELLFVLSEQESN